MEFSVENLFLLALAGAVAGFVDTVGGGGGLITLPALLLVQIPPLSALATNRLQATVGTFVAATTMWRRGVLDLNLETGSAFIGSLFGSVCGTLFILSINGAGLDFIVPFVLIFVALYFLFISSSGTAERTARIRSSVYNITVIPALGFYDGALGPGGGSFFTLAGVALRGQSIMRATANAKMLDFAGNIASLVIFVFGGKVVMIAGLTMIAGQLIGAYAGSIFVIQSGGRFIRPVIVTTCCLMLGRYLWHRN